MSSKSASASNRQLRKAKKLARAVLPFYFYVAGVLAAIAAAAVLITAEVYGKMPAALAVIDVAVPVAAFQ